MLLDVKQKSESDADILLSFDQSNCKVGPNRCWLAGSNLLEPLDRCRNATSGLIAKAVRRTPARARIRTGPADAMAPVVAAGVCRPPFRTSAWGR
jgi:hypothetical protein